MFYIAFLQVNVTALLYVIKYCFQEIVHRLHDAEAVVNDLEHVSTVGVI